MWKIKDSRLYKKVEFEDFAVALKFINRVGEVAEKANHHPTIKNSYNVVELELTTHSENKITDKDYQLAKQIDGIVVENSKV